MSWVIYADIKLWLYYDGLPFVMCWLWFAASVVTDTAKTAGKGKDKAKGKGKGAALPDTEVQHSLHTYSLEHPQLYSRIAYTVEPLCKGHPWCKGKVDIVVRLPLYGNCFKER